MRGTPSRLRGTALVAVGALTLHELRYAVAPPSADQVGGGHGYLPLAGMVCALVLALAFAQLVSVAARARRTGAGEGRGLSFRCVWLLCVLALAGIFFAQELLEGALAPNRGLAGALGAGAWVSLPLAVVLGAIVSLALVGARAVVVAAARRSRHAGPERRRREARRLLPRRAPPAASLARHPSMRPGAPAAGLTGPAPRQRAQQAIGGVFDE